jgi:hypothetical protein
MTLMSVARVILGAMIMLAILWANIPSSGRISTTSQAAHRTCRGSDIPRQDNAHLPSICQLKNLSSSAVFRERRRG